MGHLNERILSMRLEEYAIFSLNIKQQGLVVD